jgi:hypothetical protein
LTGGITLTSSCISTRSIYLPRYIDPFYNIDKSRKPLQILVAGLAQIKLRLITDTDKNSDVAEPTPPLAIEITPSICAMPENSVVSWLIGGNGFS